MHLSTERKKMTSSGSLALSSSHGPTDGSFLESPKNLISRCPRAHIAKT